MPICIFILSRFTLPVDNLLFRAHDMRIYHSFASTRLGSALGACQAGTAGVRSSNPNPQAHLCFVGCAAAGRPDAAHIPELCMSDTFGSAKGDLSGGWRRLGNVVQVTTLYAMRSEKLFL